MKSLTQLNTFSAASVAYDDQGTGAQTLADRYQINGLIDTGESVMSNIEKICSAAGSYLSYDIHLGKWGVIINTTGTSVASFDDTNILGSITISGTGINELYNSVKVEFPHRELRDSADFVTIEIADVDRNANEEDNTLNLTYDIINEPIQAQLLGLIELKQSRIDLAISFQTDYSNINVKAGDLIDVTNARFGFTNKLFRVISCTEIQDDDGALKIEISALEYDANVYSTADLFRYTRTDENGIITIGSIGVPGTPQVTKIQTDARPRIIIETTSPTGVVEGIEYWITEDTLVAEANRSYRLIGTRRPSGGNTFTSGVSVTLEYDAITTGDFIVKTRGINAQTTGPFSTPSGLIEFVAQQITDAIGPNTQSIDATGQILTLIGANLLMKAVDGIFTGSTSTSSIFTKIFDIFKDTTGVDLVGQASGGTLSVAQNLAIKDEGVQVTAQVTDIDFVGPFSVSASGNSVTVQLTGESAQVSGTSKVGDGLIWNGTAWVPYDGNLAKVTPDPLPPELLTFGDRYPPDRNSYTNSINSDAPDAATTSGSYFIYVAGNIYGALSKGSGNAKLYKSDGTLVETIAASGSIIDKNLIELPFATRDLGTDYYITMNEGFVTYCTKDSPEIKLPSLNTTTTEVYYDRNATAWNFNTPLYHVAPYSLTGAYTSPPNVPILSSISLVKNFYKSETQKVIKTRNTTTGVLINPPIITTSTIRTVITNYKTFIDNQRTAIANGYANVEGGVLELLQQNDDLPACATDYLILNFNRSIKMGSGNIYIKRLSSGTTVGTINVTDGKITTSETSIIFDRISSKIDIGETHYITHDAGIVIGYESDCVSSFPCLAKTDNSITFNVETAPVFTGFTVDSLPVESGNINKVNPQTEIRLNFDRSMRFKTSGYVRIYKSDASLHQEISIANVLSNEYVNELLWWEGTTMDSLSIELSETPNIKDSGSTLVINPTRDLTIGATYYVQVTAATLEDDCGVSWNGITDTSTVRFKVDPGPTASFAPISSTSTKLVMTFDRPIEAGTGTLVVKVGSTILQTATSTSSSVTLA